MTNKRLFFFFLIILGTICCHFNTTLIILTQFKKVFKHENKKLPLYFRKPLTFKKQKKKKTIILYDYKYRLGLVFDFRSESGHKLIFSFPEASVAHCHIGLFK